MSSDERKNFEKWRKKYSEVVVLLWSRRNTQLFVVFPNGTSAYADLTIDIQNHEEYYWVNLVQRGFCIYPPDEEEGIDWSGDEFDDEWHVIFLDDLSIDQMPHEFIASDEQRVLWVWDKAKGRLDELDEDS